MSFLSLSFATPALLIALAILPIIWWLNRLTPPKPQREPFPPFAILLKVLKKEDTPAKSPWWLTLLRVLLCAFIIIALADPILNPRENRLTEKGTLLLVIDDSWSTTSDWEQYLITANAFIDDAEANNLPVIIAQSTSSKNIPSVGTAADARRVLAAISPQPMKPFQTDIVTPIKTALAGEKIGTLAIIASNIGSSGSSNALGQLFALNPKSIQVAIANNPEIIAIKSATNNSTSVSVDFTRLDANTTQEYPVVGYDLQSRPLMNGIVKFSPGDASSQAELNAPYELINDVVRISVGEQLNAGASHLIDDRFRRRRIAIFSGETNDIVNPLLTSTHYIDRATSPYADIIDVRNINLNTDIEKLTAQNPSAIILSNIGILEQSISDSLVTWLEAGGTLIRFAGPKLTASENNDPLLPVRLRSGERQLGGALSWTEPKPLAEFPPQSPYFGIEIPEEITINRQVLAEPDLDLSERTWASLVDGTPLVTSKNIDSGRIVLFHISAETSWSNLPLSGQFAEMLRRTIALSRATSVSADVQGGNSAFLPPFRTMSAAGILKTASGDINPLEISDAGQPVKTPETMPGLYGTQDGWQAINLFSEDDELLPLEIPDTDIDIIQSSITSDEATSLKPWFLALAFILLIADALIIMLMSGALLKRGFSQKLKLGMGQASILIIGASAIFAAMPNKSHAQDAKIGDANIINRLETTHIAYVETGDARVDRISKLGLDGLVFYLSTRTALEPGNPVAVDIETDELSFYPLIYWPISDNAQIPSAKGLANIDKFMKQGGTILFDTRDELSGFGSAGNLSPRTLKLRAILSGLDIPPLEPVPQDHVLTKSFYLLDSFPGRYAGGTLWVEALSPDGKIGDGPVQAGDGVSPIMITSNDFAGAWAINASRQPILPTIPQNERQRVLAYRTGINIMMYMLTGNYKADQVHIPALLKRLGQ